MTDKEKLIEILRYGMDKYFLLKFEAEIFADLLISNGVTFAKDINVGSELFGNSEQFKWSGVEDELPEHGDVVLCWHKAKDYPIVLQLDKRSGCWLDDQWDYGMGLITHWMPLPEPPKEEQNAT